MPSLAELIADRLGHASHESLQIANQQFFLPCALLFVKKSLKEIVLLASANEDYGLFRCYFTTSIHVTSTHFGAWRFRGLFRQEVLEGT